ncbi:methyl-accepting chemotaxis protein [Paenibacillus sp. CCS19]|uniref:methyl-accepting chemotaxis protein n=1 Tax=Paenibacillus sp. CCS19 TaxID=3158387 RepID=UPI002563B66A|nr:methyl-accepting chemotaxis protein [Paenibacillus cellulosilyticus]GMK37621.1 methyl-accepting chemotaxis protein [Paenibacillus cellulosilyticus]
MLAKEYHRRIRPEGNRFRIKSIHMKLTVSLLVTVLLIVGILSTINFYSYRSAYEEKVAESSSQTITIASRYVEQLLDGYLTIANDFQHNQDLLNLLSHYNTARQDSMEENIANSKIIEVMQGYSQMDPNILSISMIPAQEHPIVTTLHQNTLNPLFINPTTENRNEITELDWYKKIAEKDGQPVWLPTRREPLISLYQEEPIYALGKQLTSPLSKKPLGTLIIELSSNTLSKSIEGIEIGPSGQTAIVDKNGTVIYAMIEEQIGTTVTNLLPPAASDGSSELIEGSFSNTREDMKQLNVFSYLPGPEWFIVGSAPTSQLLKEVSEMQRLSIIAALVLGAIGCILIGLFIRRSIGLPLAQIRRLMTEGERGNLMVRSNMQRMDEIGDLGRSFDRMMEHISFLVRQTHTSSDALLHTAQRLIDSSTRTSKSADEIALSMNEMAIGADRLAEDAEYGHQLTIQNEERLTAVIAYNEQMESTASILQNVNRQGQDYMMMLYDQTSDVENVTKQLILDVNQLKSGAGSIVKVLRILGEMTKQTNLLALNASIEANRAGSAGKGFMVIAEEIRKLSLQSKHSLEDVESIIASIQTDTEHTVGSLNGLYPLFRKQLHAIDHSKEVFSRLHAEIATFVIQLNDVRQSVSQLTVSQSDLFSAMTSVSAVSEQTSASSKQVASLSIQQSQVSNDLNLLSSQLKGLALELRESLNRFTL